MHYTTAARTYKLPLETARFVLDAYRRAIPEIPQWWDKVRRVIDTTSTIVNPFGRRRMFFNRTDNSLYRTAFSHSAQSIVADIIGTAVRTLDNIIDPNQCQLLLQVHDEIVGQVRTEHVDKWLPIVKSHMEVPVKFPDIDIPMVIPVDLSVGPNWMDTKPYANNPALQP
jgi:DNA polymerase-1